MTVRKTLRRIESDDSTLVQYESLRLQALNRQGEGSERGLGLALFIRRGMLAWMQVCHKCMPAEANRQKRTETAVFAYEKTSEIIKVMANITLFNLEEALA